MFMRSRLFCVHLTFLENIIIFVHRCWHWQHSGLVVIVVVIEVETIDNVAVQILRIILWPKHFFFSSVHFSLLFLRQWPNTTPLNKNESSNSSFCVYSLTLFWTCQNENKNGSKKRVHMMNKRRQRKKKYIKEFEAYKCVRDWTVIVAKKRTRFGMKNRGIAESRNWTKTKKMAKRRKVICDC